MLRRSLQMLCNETFSFPREFHSHNLQRYLSRPLSFWVTSLEPTDFPKKDYCWIQTRGRYRSKGDPRFYYARKGHTIDTSHDSKPPPKWRPKRTTFPKLSELPMNMLQLYRDMKPKSTGRNAFKRKWRRWIQSIKDQRRILLGKEEAKRRLEEKERMRVDRLKQLQEDWETISPHLGLPPSLSFYLEKRYR